MDAKRWYEEWYEELAECIALMIREAISNRRLDMETLNQRASMCGMTSAALKVYFWSAFAGVCRPPGALNKHAGAILGYLVTDTDQSEANRKQS